MMNKQLPSSKVLQAFLVTAESLNFTHAAHTLNLTQGAISRQIQMLEEYVGTKLFYRHARGLALTQKGAMLAPLIKENLEQLHQSLAMVSASPTKVNLNAPSCITSWLLPKLMAFQQAHPDIDVELTSTIKHKLEPQFEPFDAVIIYGKQPKLTSISSHLLFDEHLTPICRNDIWKNERDSKIDDVTEHTWLHANPEQSDWRLWLEHVGRTDLLSKNNQIFSTLDQAMNAAMQGFGLVVGDITLAKGDLEMGRVIAPFDQVVTSGNSYYLVQPKARHNDSLNSLINWLLGSVDLSTTNFV